MAKVVLISCVSKKLPYKAKARDLYVSPLFRRNLTYANSLKPDKIFVLSAQYGLVGLDEEIDTYDKTLNRMSTTDIKDWADNVIRKLEGVADLDNDEFILLAGERYRRFLVPRIKRYQIPLKGLGIGKQLQFLKGRADE